jgi:hypothetical protein
MLVEAVYGNTFLIKLLMIKFSLNFHSQLNHFKRVSRANGKDLVIRVIYSSRQPIQILAHLNQVGIKLEDTAETGVQI